MRLFLNTFVVVCLFLSTSNVQASVIRTDPLLDPHYSFHYIFITDSKTTAESKNIEDYNTWVQAQADAAGIGSSIGLSWNALISTSQKSAKENVNVVGPVYTLDFRLVATNEADLFDGTIASRVNFTEVGRDLSLTGTYYADREPWTGSDSHGEQLFDPNSGVSLAAGEERVQIGYSLSLESHWIQSRYGPPGPGPDVYAENNDRMHPLYAVSSRITNYELMSPNPVPLPPSLLLMASGLVSCVGIRWRFRH